MFGHRAARRESAACACRKAHHLFQPVDHLPVKLRRRRVAATEIGPVNGRKKIAECAGEITRAHVPTPKTRVDVAHRIGHEVGGHVCVYIFQRCRLVRHRRQIFLANTERHFLPDGSFAHMAQMMNGVVNDPVRQRSCGSPVLRIERFFRDVDDMARHVHSLQTQSEAILA
jgi:hypothetical protein